MWQYDYRLRHVNRSAFAVSCDIITYNGAAMRGEVVNHTGAQWLAWPGPDWVIYRQGLFYAWLGGLLTQGSAEATVRGKLASVVGIATVPCIYKASSGVWERYCVKCVSQGSCASRPV